LADVLQELLELKNAAVMASLHKPTDPQQLDVWRSNLRAALRAELLLVELQMTTGRYLDAIPNVLSAQALLTELAGAKHSNEWWQVKLRHHTDPPSDEYLRIRMELEPGQLGIGIHADGYGVKTMHPGYGAIAFLEKYEGKLRLLVWADINQEDPTHTIELEGASEKHWKDDE
jgi:hypothetical protein